MTEGAGLTGSHRVRLFRPVFKEMRKLCRTTKEGMVLRRNILKIRYWPEHHPKDNGGTICDIDWSWIRSIHENDIGELRIGDSINGNDNLRAIFYTGDPKVRDPLPLIWILTVFQKKKNYFTGNQLNIFRARRELVKERFYRNRL